MYFYILTDTGLYLRKISRQIGPVNNYSYELTSDIKAAGLFFCDQFNLIRETVPGRLYAAKAVNIDLQNLDFKPL